MVQEDATSTGSGIVIQQVRSELPPPPPPAEEEQTAPDREGAEKKVREKTTMPIAGAVVKPPLRFEGHLLKELTGYEGWIWSEDDLDDIMKLVEAAGLEASPMMQLIIAMSGIHLAKGAGYLAWRRTQRNESDEVEAHLA